MTTVREIAELAGVSKSTVSLVLNNKPGVSDEMRQTVMNAVNELETIRADQPRSERTLHNTDNPKMQALSIMVLHPPVLRSSYVFSEVLHGIQHAAERHNVQLRLVANDRNVSAQHVSYLYLTDDHLRPDGVLVFGAQQYEPLLDEAVERNFPCVVLGRDAKKYAVSGIERDEQHYAYLLTEHLLEQGHRAIAFIGGEEQYDYTNNRVAGFQRAMLDAGIPTDAIVICLGDGATATEHVLVSHPHVTAVIYVNDSYASEGVPILAQHNKRIPTDIAVASFDNTTYAQEYEVPLTSIAYNHFEEGQWAVKMLLDQIRFPLIKKSCLTFDGELIIRQSTVPN